MITNIKAAGPFNQFFYTVKNETTNEVLGHYITREVAEKIVKIVKENGLRQGQEVKVSCTRYSGTPPNSRS